MKKIKKYILLLMVFFVFFSTMSCSKKSSKPDSKTANDPKPMPKVIKEIEKNILKIMTQADKIPYFEKVIIEKKVIQEEKKRESLQIEELKNKENNKKAKEDLSNTIPQQEEPKPMMITESILSELMKRENISSDHNATEKPPKNTAETWKKINDTIKGIHDQWNILEPLLMQESVSSDIIADFETTLNALTECGVQQNYLDTMITANRLTFYLSKLRPYFKKTISPTIYTLKYYVRNIVLNTAIDNYTTAQENLNQMKEQSQNIKSELIQKKSKSIADKFDVSIVNLQKAIDKKDMTLIKINASIVLKNIILVEEKLATAM